MATRRTRRAVEALGRRAAEYAFDLALGQNVRVSTRQVAKELGGLDILVMAAGVELRRPTEKISDAEWTRALSAGLSGVFYAVRSALGEMTAGGRILCVVSDLATRGSAEQAAISAAQHGVIGLLRTVAVEYAGRGVAANALAVAPEDAASEAGGNALGSLALFLASDAASAISGELFTVRGSLHPPAT